MKKLQIMAGMLSVLLLAGCGGAGASAKTTEGDPPQVASAAASGTTAAQNGNENPSEVVTQDEAERPGPVDAEPSGEKKTTSSAGETKPKAEDPPVQVLPAETVPPEAPPTESAPSKPVTDETAPQPEEKGFDIDYWLAYAKDCAVSIPPSGSGQNGSETDSTNCSSVVGDAEFAGKRLSWRAFFLCKNLGE